MKKFLVLCLVLGTTMVGWGAARLVIYSPGFAFVEETRVLELEQEGTLLLRDLPREWMPDSLTVEGLTLLRTRPLGLAELLAGPTDPRTDLPVPAGPSDLIGQVVQVTAGGRTLTGRLLAAGQNLVLATLDGTVIVPDYERLTLPEPLGAAVELQYAAQEGPAEVVLRYLTQGLRWSVRYAAVLNEEVLDLTGWAQLVNTTGVTFDEAEIELLAGDVGTPRSADLGLSATLAFAAAPPAAEVEIAPAAEYQRYTLPGRVDLGEGTVYVPLVSGSLDYARVYRFRGGPVEVIVAFENELVPLPAGEVRVFEDEGELFAGAARIGHTPVGERIELAIGSAFDLTGERTLMSRVRPTDVLYRDTYRIVLRSAKDVDVTVEVLEAMQGVWDIVQASQPYEAVSAHQIRFDAEIPAGGEAVVEYTVEWRR